MARGLAQPAMSSSLENRGRKSAVWRFLPIGLVLAGLIVGYAMGWQRYLTLGYLGMSQDVLTGFVDAHPVNSMAGFVVAYAVAVALSFPAASVLTIFGGFLFGWALGALLSVIGATSGATALFLAARTAFGDRLRKRLGGLTERFAKGFEEDAFAFLLVLRLAPFIPFFLVNIAPAFFNVRLRTFVAATAIGIVPGGFAYAWLGQGVGSVLDAAQAAGRNATATDLVTPEITFAFAALALVALVAAVLRKRWKHKHGAEL